MRPLPQAQGIVFELQRKKSNEKITRGKISFFQLKKRFFFFFLVDLSYFQIS
jgi:hypothetical protein